MKVPLPAPALPEDAARQACCGYGVCCLAGRQDSPEDAPPAEACLVESVAQEAGAVVYSGELQPLRPGVVLSVQGRALPACERFTVNLWCSGDKREGLADLALHLNPRLSQRYMVRNARLAGRWGPEETAAVRPFPFRRERPFSIDIFVADNSFYCQVDSEHYCEFVFRTPLSRVVGLEVRGAALEVQDVRRGEARAYPAGAPPPRPVPAAPGPDAPDPEPEVWGNPAVGVLAGGLPRGRQLVLEGRVRMLPHSFYLNLQSSVQRWPHPDIPLHVNPRFMAGRKHVVVRNSWHEGSWGAEERAETSQLSPGQPFVLRVSCEDEQYSVWAGDSLIGVFPFRMPAECVRAVLVQGDVHVQRMYQIDTPSYLVSMADEF